MPSVYLSPTLTESDQLREWRRAVGDPAAVPATVPLEVRAVVGNLTLTVRGQEKLPTSVGPTVKALLAGKRRKVKPKGHPSGKPALFAALPRPGADRARHLDPQQAAQLAAYRRAIETGEWAPC